MITFVAKEDSNAKENLREEENIFAKRFGNVEKVLHLCDAKERKYNGMRRAYFMPYLILMQ